MGNNLNTEKCRNYGIYMLMVYSIVEAKGWIVVRAVKPTVKCFFKGFQKYIHQTSYKQEENRMTNGDKGQLSIKQRDNVYSPRP